MNADQPSMNPSTSLSPSGLAKTVESPLGSVRRAGVLLHPTSLPGAFGIGDFGPVARDWVRQLGQSGIGWWQVLPLGPVGYGFSPYSSSSTFAWNPLLISPEDLVAVGLLHQDELLTQGFPTDQVDVPAVQAWKQLLLTWAYARFRRGEAPALRDDFEAFQAREADWLHDFGLYQAIKTMQGGSSWQSWPAPLRLREPQALEQARRDLAESIKQFAFEQFLADRQWDQLRLCARQHGVQILGDIPIFVAEDSCDAWSQMDLFFWDDERRPAVRAGVPPDYFCPQGQLWGNPMYDWHHHQETGFAWWVRRLSCALTRMDLLRIDHFRGFAASWHVPQSAPTAETGHWEPGPGRTLFDSFRQHWGSLPLVAEDLGLITPDVEALREVLGLPGMRVLQFAWDGKAANPYLPHNYETNTVVYTGTHDNDTTIGWFEHLPQWEKDRLLQYSRMPGTDPAWELIRLAWSSVARLAFAPLQDVLRLDSAARMNTPGVATGNWGWRFSDLLPWQEALGRLGDLARQYNR